MSAKAEPNRLKPVDTRGGAKKASAQKSVVQKDHRLFELEVMIIGGLMTKSFMKTNPRPTRTIELRGDQTLEKLHDTIFKAFDRFDPHMYEFRLNAESPRDKHADRYVPSELLEDPWYREKAVADTENTTIGSLGLSSGSHFLYWFGFGDDWWHKIKVTSISEKAEGKGYPKITARTGESPPQYVDRDEIEN